MLRPVVLAGGNGVRLWPLSRASLPKPFLPLLPDGRSPFEAAVGAAGAVGEPLVLCRDVHRFVAAEQIGGLGVPARLVLEPESRGDGAALALAASLAPDDTLLVLPSEDPGALPAAGSDPGPSWTVGRDGERVVYDLVAASTVLEAVEGLAGSSALQALSRSARLSRDLSFLRVDRQAWDQVPHLDIGILRRAAGAREVSAQAGAQVADFAALHAQGDADSDGNVTVGDVALIGSRGCLVRSSSRLVTVVDGVDLAVVETADAVLVAPIDAGDRVRDLVALLETQDRVEAQLTQRVLRPWGAFEAIAHGPRWKAKRIVVQPGQALSLQRHEHRAEHWVVVRGTARVHRGEDVVEIGVDASTYIPRGTVHRLENPGDEPLVVVEIQTGDRLDEDDIERLEDRYGR